MKPADITLLSTADWDNPFWTNKQHVAVALARRGHRILYVDSLGLRRPSASAADLRRIARRVRKSLAPPRLVHDRIWVGAPAVLPLQRYAAVRRANRLVLRAGLALWRRRLGMAPHLLWTYNPMTTRFLDLRTYDMVVYHCVDDIKEQPGMPAIAIEEAEAELVRRADVVFTTSRRLHETRQPLNPNTHYFPNVADFDHFARALEPAGAIPADLEAVPPPRIGFIGAVSGYKIDFALLDYVARARPEWHVVLIGRVGEGDPWTQTQPLSSRPNVHLLGPKPYGSLPDYLRGFDVAILPSTLNAYTAAMFPMKFFEYLAAGRPVVSVALPALAEYAHVAYFASTPDDFVRGIEAALRGHAPSLEARLAAARPHTYTARTAAMMEIVERHAERKAP